MSELSQKSHRNNKVGRALRSSPSHKEGLWLSTGNGGPPPMDWAIKIAVLSITQKGAHKISAFPSLALPNRGIAISLLNWQNVAISNYPTLNVQEICRFLL